ncbi:MAG TPA: thiopeptide-type bacteriocin biosynthesis protein [Candidatus Dormibacteraeota bacterium]|jgi:thiopeptide-type bacteriocin biosynthesis protein
MLEEPVLRVLAGAPTGVVAAEAAYDAGLLLAGVEAYLAAGGRALASQDTVRWKYWRIEVTGDAADARRLVADLAPLLDHLTRDGSTGQWWFLVKDDGTPHVRLRLLGREPGLSDRAAPAIESELAAACRSGRLRGWCTVPYEPEVALFGGPEGMRLSHALLHRDSRAAARWLAAGHARTEEASVVAIRGLLVGAELDIFEQGDVWARVASQRPLAPGRPAPGPGAIGWLYAAGPDELRALLGDGEAYGAAVDWAVELHRSGEELAAAARRGDLGRGLRAILATHVIFHWNRAGLSAAAQASLAHRLAGWIFDDERGPLVRPSGGESGPPPAEGW